MTQRQLPLMLRFPQGARFDRFAADGNEATLALLRAFAEHPTVPGVLLVGPNGSGKSHLAMAVAAVHPNAALLPLNEFGDRAEIALAATTVHGLLIIDDIAAIAGQRAAEIALFDLFNRVRDAGGAVLATTSMPLSRIGLNLPDLASRLASLTMLRLNSLDDAARRRVIHEHGRARGMEIRDDVLDFLFRRYPRDLGVLLDLLDRLDREGLARQRRLTVALVRDVLQDLPPR